MGFNKIRLWTMTESGNLSVKIARHPGQQSFEWYKWGWRIFSRSHACHSDSSFTMISCCLNFCLLRCYNGECAHKLKYSTISIHKTMWEIHLFMGVKIIVNCFSSSLTCLSLGITFLCPLYPIRIPTVTQTLLSHLEKDWTVSKYIQT